MPRHRTVAFVWLLTSLGIVGCGRQQAAPPAAKAPPVTVVRPATASVGDYWEYNGYLDEIETVEVRARVRGFLTKVHFTEGKEIPKDTLLYEIDKREYLTAQAKAKADLEKAKADVEKAKADVLNWKAQIRLAEAELERVNKSVASGVGSKTDQDKAQATLDVNKAQLSAAEATQLASVASSESAASALHSAEIQLGYTEIRAKMGGQIGRTLVHEGNLVGQSDPTLLTAIIRVDKLYAWFDVPEKDVLDYLRDADKLHLPVPPAQTIPMLVRLPGENEPWHPGEIDYVEGRVNTGTGTVRARAVVPNPPRASGDVRVFVPGLYIHVRVPKGPSRPQLVLPEDALMTGQEGRFVFVVGANDIVEKRILTVGPSVWKAPPQEPGVVVPSWMVENPTPPPPPEKGPPLPTRRPIKSVVAITAGLKPDDRVIVDGVQRSRPGAPVTPELWVMNPPPETKK